jgi:colanic acid/amylovoran biosynthesis glycosyltransferase
MPVRIAYLISQYPAVNHTYILQEIRTLRTLGIEIHVISIRPPDRPPERLSVEELQELRATYTVLSAGIGRILAAHLRTFFGRPLAYLSGLWQALRLSAGNPRKAISNVIYFGEAVVIGRRLIRLGLTHLHCHFASTVAFFVAAIFPVTFSVTIHGDGELKDPIGFHLAEKIACVRFICCVSSHGRSQLMKASEQRYWNKLEVSPLGVDCTLFSPPASRRHRGPFEIVCVATLSPPKGLPLLIKAVDHLVRQERSVHLRLVGDGPHRRDLERQIANLGLQAHVTLEGNCNQDRVQAFYREADLFALASFAEGIPVVLMEAMAMEVPCVATWITGIPELIRHGIDGWLVAPGDVDHLADAIATLMDDPELRQRLGRSARIRVQEKYDLARNTERLAEIYRRRLASNSS